MGKVTNHRRTRVEASSGVRVRSRRVDLPRRRLGQIDKATETEKEPVQSFGRESMAVVFAAVGVFLCIAIYAELGGSLSWLSFSRFADDVNKTGIDGNTVNSNPMGFLGHYVAQLLVRFLGWCSFVIAGWMFLLSRIIWVSGWPRGGSAAFGAVNTVCGSVLMVASCASMVSVFFGYEGGGRIGSAIAFRLIGYVNEPGALLVSFVAFLLSLAIGTDIATSQLLSAIGAIFNWFYGILCDVGFLCRSAATVFIRFEAWVLKRFGLASLSCLKAGRGLFGYALYTTFVSLRNFIVNRKVSLVETDAAPFVGLSRDVDVNDALHGDFNDLHGNCGQDVSFVFDDDMSVRSKVREQEQLSQKKIAQKKTAQNGAEQDEVEESASPRAKLRIKRGERGGRSRCSERKLTKMHRFGRGGGKKDKEPNKCEGSQTYKLPSVDLLTAPDPETEIVPQDDELMENSKRLEQSLQDFRIGGAIVEVQPGPVVTLYQFQPAAGVKVQRIISLADDLALALKVASVRVYAPVPGKGTVGIEVPNANRQLVCLRDVFESDVFANSNDSHLTLALGQDTFGEAYAADLSKMPHLLIAGATGTGKSVCINSILLSLLYRNTPSDLRLILIDPKMLELSMYESIPHLLAPVVTQASRARGVLWWAVEEMERRYRLMKDCGVRGIAGYNATIRAEFKDLEGSVEESKSTQPETLPYVVIVVDELADLMLTVGREIEELITRLAQKARAAGIHLILATQRPSVNVITGLIKANFPSRISFQVASRIDARTVMDTSGAERLLGRGDMLFLPPGTGRLKRLHSPFVSDNEVRDVVEWIRGQGAPQYNSEIEAVMKRLEESRPDGAGGEDAEYDELYDRAVQLVVEKGQASTSMVQRAFRIGYNRAARILETMEGEGVVGPADGAKPRQVIVPYRE